MLLPIKSICAKKFLRRDVQALFTFSIVTAQKSGHY